MDAINVTSLVNAQTPGMVSLTAANDRSTATRFEFEVGYGTGIRTLNFAVNRSLRPAPKGGLEFAE
jgi:hypothetical protein